MSGVESISGKSGQYYFQDMFVRLDEKYLKKIFCAPEAEHDMLSLLSSLPSLTDHYLQLYGPDLVSAQDLISIRSPSGCDNQSFEEDSERGRVININDEETRLECQASLK